MAEAWITRQRIDELLRFLPARHPWAGYRACVRSLVQQPENGIFTMPYPFTLR